ncbi:hypothetical protein VTH06DRAFT_8480 [Thermothelomyces fergusii]
MVAKPLTASSLNEHKLTAWFELRQILKLLALISRLSGSVLSERAGARAQLKLGMTGVACLRSPIRVGQKKASTGRPILSQDRSVHYALKKDIPLLSPVPTQRQEAENWIKNAETNKRETENKKVPKSPESSYTGQQTTFAKRVQQGSAFAASEYRFRPQPNPGFPMQT